MPTRASRILCRLTEMVAPDATPPSPSLSLHAQATHKRQEEMVPSTMRQRYQQYHAGDPRANEFSRTQKIGYSAAKIATEIPRLSFHKRLPVKYQRAGAIARRGLIGVAATYPITKAVSGSAGTIAGLHPDDRTKLFQTVHHSMTDPDLRKTLASGAVSYLKDPETLRDIGQGARQATIRAVAPIMQAGKLAPQSGTAGGGASGDGLQVLHHIQNATSVHMPIHRISKSLEGDPLLGWAAGQIKGVATHLTGTPGGSSSWQDKWDNVKHMGRLAHKVTELPIFKKG